MEFVLVGYCMKDGAVDNITCKGKKTFSSQITGYYLYTQRVKKTTFLYVSRRMFWRANENVWDQSITQKLQLSWN